MSKRIVLVNGSARKNGNTCSMLRKIEEGAVIKGAEVEMIHLSDLDFKGCYSCFACKELNGDNYGHCAVNDGIRPVLQKIEESDAFVLGSPIYWGNLSGQMRSFMERLLFQYLVYGKQPSSASPKTFHTALVTTMNIGEALYEPSGLEATIGQIHMIMKMMFGDCEVLNLYETVQFDDYSKYVYSSLDKEEKSKRDPVISHENLEKAFNLGVKLAACSD